VELALAEYLAVRRAEVADVEPQFANAVDSLVRFVLGGGKRIRPLFAWWGWRGAGGDADGPRAAAVLRAVSALELIQACALVHDDLMDASAVRRGAPTVHVEFAALHHAAGWQGPPERFGLAASVLLGDIALAWADDMLHAAGLAADELARAMRPWQLMRTEMLGGQYLDVLNQAQGNETLGPALRVNRLKTAAYTVERPLHIGAALAGAPEELIAAYRKFGSDLGVAFQLRDDLLGMFGDPAVTGKPAGDDLREGKRTMLMSVGLSRADSLGRQGDADILRAALGDAELDVAEVDRVRDLLVDLGAADQVERWITEYLDNALTALQGADISEPAAGTLAALATAVSRRNR
jgi:geranylgeranyl diphosphate synthase type I